MATSSTLVKVLGGRSELQIAPLGETSTHPAFSSANVQQLMATIEEPINAWKTITYTYQAHNPDYLDTLLQPLLAVNPPLVSVRFGLAAESAGNWRPWEDFVIVSCRYSSRADPKSGPLVTIKLCDRLWLLHTVKKAAAHRGAIGVIVNNIWTEDAGGQDSTIEPTQLPGHSSSTGLWYQAYESSWSFLMRCLVPLAENENGTAGYRLFVADNKLRFHCPGYGAPEPKKLLYTAGTPGFDSLELEDHFVELAGGAGAAGARRLVHDPVTGESKLIEADPARLVKFAGQRAKWNNWEYRGAHVGRNLAAAEDAINQQRYASLNGEVYRCEFSSDKCMDVRVGDLLDIVLAATDSDSITHSGIWLINKAVHTLQEGGLTTRYVATRGDFNQPASKQISGSDELERDLVTPGLDLNLAGGIGNNDGSVLVPILATD